MAELRALDGDLTDQELLQAVIDFYRHTLLETPKALEYLRRRGLDDRELLERCQIGFADRALARALPSQDSKAGRELRERLTRLGIFRGSGHGHFNGCLVVPILGPAGDVREIYGRKINSSLRKGTPRHLYLNDPPRGVWNSGALESTDTVILCKSLIDALTFWSVGYRHVTSTYGYGPLSRELLDTLEEHDIRQILLAYEHSERGDSAAAQVTDQLAEINIRSLRIELPRGLDVNAFARNAEVPAEALKELIDRAQGSERPVSETSPTRTMPAVVPEPKGLDIEQSDGEVTIRSDDRRWRVRGLEKQLSHERLKVNLMVSRLDAVHVDTFDLYSARHRAAFINQAASELYVDETVLKQELGRVLLTLEQLQDERIRKTLTPAEQSAPEMTETERTAALELLHDPQLLDRIVDDLAKCGVVGEETNKLVGYLAATSRKLDRPLAVLIQSSSAAGKTSLMDGVLALMPPEEQVKYSAITGQSLFYMGRQNLKHKILALAEEEGTQQASYALKLLQSEGVLRIAATGRSRDNGRMETEDYVVEGPTMVFLTTTSDEVDEELVNRCLTLSVNEDREQTRAIHRRQRYAVTLEGHLDEDAQAEIQRLHQNAQRLLRPLLVAIPQAEQLTFLDNLPRTRRDHVKYLTLIRAVTLLHQFQRTVRQVEKQDQTIEYLESTRSDIEVANQLAAEVLGHSLAPVPQRARQLLMLLDDYVAQRCRQLGVARGDYRFTQREMREAIGWSAYQMSMHLGKLAAWEYVLVHRGDRGNQKRYELVYDGQGKDGKPFLMGLIDVSQIPAYDIYDNNPQRPDDRNEGSGTRTEGPFRGGLGPDLGRIRPNKNGASPDGTKAERRSMAKTSANGQATVSKNTVP